MYGKNILHNIQKQAQPGKPFSNCFCLEVGFGLYAF